MPQKYDFSDITVMIIEDNLFMRQLVRKMLHGFGVRHLLEGADGSEGLEILSRDYVDLVICDWLMDPLDGCGFTQTVRTATDSPNTHLPIVMITGHTEPWRIRFARDAGVTEILAKPVSAQKLMERMVYVIEEPRRSVDSFAYAGPDRRRRRFGTFTGKNRRNSEDSQADAMAETGASVDNEDEDAESSLSNEAVDSLFSNINS